MHDIFLDLQNCKQLFNCNQPAVSHIWAFIVTPSVLMLRVANSTPIVDFDSKLNSPFVNLLKRFDFPTPESPINTTNWILWIEKIDYKPLNKKWYSSSSLLILSWLLNLNMFQWGSTRSFEECWLDKKKWYYWIDKVSIYFLEFSFSAGLSAGFSCELSLLGLLFDWGFSSCILSGFVHA